MNSSTSDAREQNKLIHQEMMEAVTRLIVKMKSSGMTFSAISAELDLKESTVRSLYAKN